MNHKSCHVFTSFSMIGDGKRSERKRNEMKVKMPPNIAAIKRVWRASPPADF